MIFKPRPYQTLARDFIIATPHANLWAGMGLGKSASTLMAIDTLRFSERLGRVLVLAPKRVALTVWPEEVTLWDIFRHLDVSVIMGTAAQRRKALSSQAPIHVINYENVNWLLDELHGHWPYAMVVADEASRLKASDSNRFRGVPKRRVRSPDGEIHVTPARPGLRHVAHLTPRWVNLTGTPAPNGVEGLWSQTYLLDQGARLGKNITAFRDRFMRPHPYVKHQWQQLPGARDDVIDLLRDITLTLRAEDWFNDLPPAIDNIVKVPLDGNALEVYRKLHRDCLVEIEGKTVTAVNAAVLTGKLSQATSGFLFTTHPDYEEIHDAKIDALKDVLDEAEGPVLVAYNFRPSLARLKAAVLHARELDADPETVAAWNRGEIPVLLAHPDSAGHGLSLQHGGNVLVFFDLDWDLEAHQQIKERIGPVRQAQSGYKRPVFYHYLVCPKTVDEQILARLQGKATEQDAITEAMKVCP